MRMVRSNSSYSPVETSSNSADCLPHRNSIPRWTPCRSCETNRDERDPFIPADEKPRRVSAQQANSLRHVEFSEEPPSGRAIPRKPPFQIACIRTQVVRGLRLIGVSPRSRRKHGICAEASATFLRNEPIMNQEGQDNPSKPR